MNHLVPVLASRAPAVVAAAGARASYRFLEFFTAQIRNPRGRLPRAVSRPFRGSSAASVGDHPLTLMARRGRARWQEPPWRPFWARRHYLSECGASATVIGPDEAALCGQGGEALIEGGGAHTAQGAQLGERKWAIDPGESCGDALVDGAMWRLPGTNAPRSVTV